MRFLSFALLVLAGVLFTALVGAGLDALLVHR